MNLDNLYTIKETMEALKISRQTIYRLIKKGSLKPVKIGRKKLFTEEDLKRFIENSKK